MRRRSKSYPAALTTDKEQNATMTIQLTEEIKAQLWGAATQVGLDVMKAASSGVEGTIREMNAMLNAPYELSARFPANRLIHGSMPPLPTEEDIDVKVDEENEPPPPDMSQEESGVQIHAQTLMMLREVLVTLEQLNAGQEGEEYKQWLMLVGDRVAEAAREGGFLGFGKKWESEPERKVLAEIAAVLGTPVPPAGK